MKKRIFALLLWLLLFSMSATPMGIAEDASGLYYLWDIPFGVSESEFIEQAYAKTGFSFLPYSGRIEESIEITTDKNQPISFLGYPLTIARTIFRVDSIGVASYYATSLFFDVESKTISEIFSLFDSVRLVLQEKYGDPTFAALSDNEGKLFTCEAIEGNFDAQQIADIITGDDTIRMMEMDWNNLGIYVVKTGSAQAAMIFLASPLIANASEPLEVYENPNLFADAGL